MPKRAPVPGFHETKYTEDRHFAYLHELETFFEKPMPQ